MLHALRPRGAKLKIVALLSDPDGSHSLLRAVNIDEMLVKPVDKVDLLRAAD